ncbi:MAG: cytochrome P450 [Rhodobacteraceae bacterium]|nr:cytochrome P450 [Paracoccaceae bacterium]
MHSLVPTMDDIGFEELMNDPYPSFDRIRKEASAVWVSSARINLVTRFDDIMHIERNHADFASTNPGSLMNKIMGHSLMRKDDEEHQVERKAVETAFRPGVVKQYWAPRLEAISDRLIAGFEKDGETDLFNAFAAPMAAYGLTELLGFKSDVAWQDMCDWSQSLMDAVGNYTADPAIEARGHAAAASIATEIDRAMPEHRATENPSVLSSMAHAESLHSIDQIRANVNVIVGGGLNEPRDSILTTVMALLSNPDQLAQVRENRKLFAKAFEEAVRWVAPIGMYPRRVTRDVVLGDTQLKEGDQIGLCVGAANRDPSRFENAHAFDINRPRQGHLGFGAGPHFCAGTWVARQMVGEIAVPMLFDRLKNLRLHDSKPVTERGWVFRGPTSLPVQWDV